MKTTTKLTHWGNDNGECLCNDHAGHYLMMSISTHPKAKTHHTPLGTWYAMPADAVQFMVDAYGSACETCLFGKGY